MPHAMNRIRYLDSLRALATVAVVAIHVASNNWYGFIGTVDWITFTVYAGICKFCVPVFFMISGVLFLNPARHYTIKRLYAHNIARLVLFLLVWSLIYLVFHLLENGESITGASLLDCVKSILKGDTQTHFWFVYALIGIYIVAPIIKVFTDNANKKMVEYFLVLWLIIQSFFTAISQVPLIAPVFNNIDKMMIQVTVSYLGFFVLGHYLNTYKLDRRMRRLSYVLGILGMMLSVALTMFLSMHTGIPDESCFGYFFPGIVFYSVAVFVFFKQRGEGIRPLRKQLGAEAYKCNLALLFGNLWSAYAVRLHSLGYGYLDVLFLWSVFCTSDHSGCFCCIACDELAFVEGSRHQQVHGLRKKADQDAIWHLANGRDEETNELEVA